MADLHSDLSLPADVDGAALPWDPSPAAGVDRKRFERNGGEVARLTSIVRYAAGSSFPSHTHGGGEEYLVLEGTFSDTSGDHEAGVYVRNGIGTSHAPFTRDGCIILVKLWWMPSDETDIRKVDTRSAPRQATEYGERIVLHETVHEYVAMVFLAPGRSMIKPFGRGLEVFVVEGDVESDGTQWGRWAWRRRPGTGECGMSSEEGATLLVKSDHLP